MADEEDILGFYNENKTWLGTVGSNKNYPKFIRALAGAVIEYAIEKGEETI
jgi:hypothetical protein